MGRALVYFETGAPFCLSVCLFCASSCTRFGTDAVLGTPVCDHGSWRAFYSAGNCGHSWVDCRLRTKWDFQSFVDSSWI